MIKYLILLLFSFTAFASDSPPPKKVAHIKGEIEESTAKGYYEEVMATLGIPGDRIVYIDSVGGYLSAGQAIIDMMEQEKARGTKIVCVVREEATSMAFNILTHCDRRYATRTARFLVHKAALGSWDQELRLTAKNLRREANQLSRADEPYRLANAKAIHLTLAEYDDNADEERTWSAFQLYKLGYVTGFIK